MTADHIRAAVEAAIREGVMFQWWLYLLALAIAFFGAFLGSYARRKAEHLATKEDFDQLLIQVKRTTEETEKIKAQIARISWVDQKRWEFMRELYSELLDSLYAEKEAIFKLADEEKRPVPTDSKIQALRARFIEENRAQSLAAIKRISKVRGIAGILLADDALKALDELALTWYQSIEGEPEAFYAARLEGADKAYSVILKAATRDLNIKAAT